jgi:hypothetical protein
MLSALESPGRDIRYTRSPGGAPSLHLVSRGPQPALQGVAARGAAAVGQVVTPEGQAPGQGVAAHDPPHEVVRRGPRMGVAVVWLETPP